ncbi:RNase H domain-containing protein [Trichonephila clavipes]|nr:RNase H domain-containing protein [Trichonephila clavipes]
MNLNVLEEDKNDIISLLHDLNVGDDQIISIPRLITVLNLPCKIYINRFKFQDKNLPIPAISVLLDEMVEREFQKFFIIATDASKNHQITSIAGISKKSSFAYRINHYNSIFTAEALAICQALDDLVELNVNLLVLSDSLSVLSALQNFSIKFHKMISSLLKKDIVKPEGISNTLTEKCLENVEFKKYVDVGLAFRGTEEVFGSPHNGNFMDVLELLDEFDPFICELIEQLELLNSKTKLKFTLKSLSQTRWSCHYYAVEALKDNYDNVKNMLKTFRDNENERIDFRKERQ